jgi:hypothetical protein
VTETLVKPKAVDNYLPHRVETARFGLVIFVLAIITSSLETQRADDCNMP